MVFKYIKKYKVNGKWRYVYADNQVHKQITNAVNGSKKAAKAAEKHISDFVKAKRTAKTEVVTEPLKKGEYVTKKKEDGVWRYSYKNQEVTNVNPANGKSTISYITEKRQKNGLSKSEEARRKYVISSRKRDAERARADLAINIYGKEKLSDIIPEKTKKKVKDIIGDFKYIDKYVVNGKQYYVYDTKANHDKVNAGLYDTNNQNRKTLQGYVVGKSIKLPTRKKYVSKDPVTPYTYKPYKPKRTYQYVRQTKQSIRK